jgi:hypothetical protein
MSIITADIERYTGYLEFAQDGLRNCHPNDEKRFSRIIKAYELAIAALEQLQGVL